MSNQDLRFSAVRFALAALALGVAACSADATAVDSDELHGADESVGSSQSKVSGTLTAGTTLKATSDVNLRSGPSSSYSILHVVPLGSSVTVVDGTPQNGFYKVNHAGTVGWSSGAYYAQPSAPASPAPGQNTSSSREGALARGKQVVGFSYWWGHGRWRPEGPTASTAGTCSGSCPSCSHGGSYGADCSGFVAKAWDVPSSNSDITVDSHPYSTSEFNGSSSLWSTVSRSNLQPADALVYNSGTSGHIVLYSSGDGWGSFYTYECKGCAAGCVYNLRTASSSYKGIRRAGW
jgi:uncharacterized protein YraI